MAGGCLGGIWGVLGCIWVVFRATRGAWICLTGIWVLSLCSMEPKHYLGEALNGITFVHLSILRHQNIKMSIYKVNKNHWVIWFFCFLVPVREIWRITVAMNHPVPQVMITIYDQSHDQIWSDMTKYYPIGPNWWPKWPLRIQTIGKIKLDRKWPHRSFSEYSSKYPYPIIPYIALVALKWNCFLQLKGLCRCV